MLSTANAKASRLTRAVQARRVLPGAAPTRPAGGRIGLLRPTRHCSHRGAARQRSSAQRRRDAEWQRASAGAYAQSHRARASPTLGARRLEGTTPRATHERCVGTHAHLEAGVHSDLNVPSASACLSAWNACATIAAHTQPSGTESTDHQKGRGQSMLAEANCEKRKRVLCKNKRATGRRGRHG